MFEKASRLKLRFASSKGYLATEDLWDLNLSQLNAMAKSLKKQLKESQEEDFLTEKSEEDSITELKFDLVLKILKTKLAEKKDRENKEANKLAKEKYLSILERKQNAELENMSKEEILQKIKELETK
jgi:tRNA U34 5-methylaminomethyl-2-thiouridine-forming methyltransferase MnmC